MIGHLINRIKKDKTVIGEIDYIEQFQYIWKFKGYGNIKFINISDDGDIYFHCSKYTIKENYVSIRDRDYNLLNSLLVKNRYSLFMYGVNYRDKK
jgi:hypothetical protein